MISISGGAYSANNHRTYSFDIKCLELADHFLTDDHPGTDVAADLAQHIQDAVEGWFYLRAQYPGVRPNDIVACDEATP